METEKQPEKIDFISSMADMASTLHKMDAKVNTIHAVLVGNQEFDQKGLIERVKTLEDFKEKSTSLYNKAVGAFFIGGAVWTIFWELAKSLFKK